MFIPLKKEYPPKNTLADFGDLGEMGETTMNFRITNLP
jgi:hypothetical protein